MNNLVNIILEDAERINQKIDFSPLFGKSILITGASGLNGHYFVASLKNHLKKNGGGTKVYLVAKSELPDYYSGLVDQEHFVQLAGDLTDDCFLDSLPKVDFIIHAAGYGQPGKFMIDPVKTLKLNTYTTFRLFGRLNEGGAFLFVSSSEVYSGLPQPPYCEEQIGTTNTDHFRACYIEGKRCGEAICGAFKKNGVNAKAARLSLSYGPGTREDDARVLNSFIRRAINEGVIRMMDSGNAVRSYCYITDAVELMWHILFNGKELVYNVGGHSKTSIAGLAKVVGDNCGVTVEASPEDESRPLTGAPEEVAVDMQRAESEFGKHEYVSLDEGIKKTIEWQTFLFDKTV